MDLPRASSRALLGASLLAYLALFAFYYPPTHGIEDEVGFLNQAITLSRGALTPEGAGYDGLTDFREYKGRMLGIRNPGRPLLSAPFVALAGPRGAFAAGALVHVALTLIAAALFTRLEMSPLWALLILWHPTLALYSRTVMGDAGAGALLLAAVLALASHRHRGIKSGVAVAAAAAWRYQAGLVLPFVCLAILLDRRDPDRRRQAVACLGAGAAGGAMIVAWNFWLYGDPTGIVKGIFGAQYVPRNVLFYSAVLTAIWPLMLLAPLADRARLCLARLAVWGPLLVFFLFYYFFDSGPDMIQTLVIGPRLLQPALPALIVSYACALSGLVPGPARRLPRGGVAASVLFAAAALACANGVIFSKHQRHLNGLLDARDAITRGIPAGSVVLANSVAEKIVGVPYEGIPRYRLAPLNARTAAERTGQETDAWFIALLERHGDALVDPAALESILEAGACRPIPSGFPGLILYRCGA